SAYFNATHVSNQLVLKPAGSLLAATAAIRSADVAPAKAVRPPLQSVSQPVRQPAQPANNAVGSSGFTADANINPTALVQGIAQYLHSGQMTMTTDSSGAFTFSNVPVNSQFMKCVVKAPGSAESRTDSVLLNREGSQVSREIDFTFVSYPVTGRIVDEKNNPIPNALYVWASGGAYGQADGNGYFVTSNKAGPDTLIIKKLGYQDRKVGITIKGSLFAPSDAPAASGSGGKVAAVTTNFISSLKATSTFSQAAARGNIISAAGFGFGTVQGLNVATGNKDASGITVKPGVALTPDGKVLPGNTGTAGPGERSITSLRSGMSWVGSLVQPDDNIGAAVDLGVIVLKKRIGRMLITVLDAGGGPLDKAAIRIGGTDSTEYTGTDGTRFIEGPGGDLLLTIAGPSATSYAPQQIALSVNDLDTAKRTVRLSAGSRVSGHVTAEGKPVAGADIGVEGLDYLHAVTDNTGYYSFIVSKDSFYSFRAARSGYVSATRGQSFHTDGTLDFALGNAGFDITKLLGFTVQVDRIEESGSHKKISGSFVHIPGNA
ncbi:MAG TPA: hypothetical protein VN824_05400, partial [Puia sp.]|nr:hypothetical protein [Puia sp.]